MARLLPIGRVLMVVWYDQAPSKQLVRVPVRSIIRLGFHLRLWWDEGVTQSMVPQERLRSEEAASHASFGWFSSLSLRQIESYQSTGPKRLVHSLGQSVGSNVWTPRNRFVEFIWAPSETDVFSEISKNMAVCGAVAAHWPRVDGRLVAGLVRPSPIKTACPCTCSIDH